MTHRYGVFRVQPDTFGEGSEPSGQRVAYTRVSTLDQNTARQLDGVAVDRTFTDSASGNDVNRPQLATMLGFVREGDVVIVHSKDRLARNLDDLRRVVRELTAKGGLRDHTGRPVPAGMIHHSDAGSQYTSIRFTETLALQSLSASIGSIGDAYDNAVAESFMGLFKNEAIAAGSPFRTGHCAP